jgi:hypothetical protein
VTFGEERYDFLDLLDLLYFDFLDLLDLLYLYFRDFPDFFPLGDLFTNSLIVAFKEASQHWRLESATATSQGTHESFGLENSDANMLAKNPKITTDFIFF